MRRNAIAIVVLVLLAICVLIGVGVAIVSDSAVTPAAVSPAAVQMFFGQVIGPDGGPMANATVSTAVAEMVRSTEGGWGPNRHTQQMIVVTTDASGNFQIAMPTGYQSLEIRDIRLEGYDRVIDRTWGKTRSAPPADNLWYVLLEGPKMRGTYVSDQQYPAIFPLHPSGDQRPAAWPSRGGQDFKGSGWWYHAPLPPLLPSAGADTDLSTSGQDALDIAVAWDKLLDERGFGSLIGPASRTDAKRHHDVLVRTSLEIIERRKRGEIPSQLDLLKQRYEKRGK